MARAANRLRQRLRHDDPKSLDFVLDKDNIPEDFLQLDVKVKDRRYLIFAIPAQMYYLARESAWYIDGTLKLVRQPFQQLLAINAFVKSGTCAKEVPLVFVLISGKKKSDYKVCNMRFCTQKIQRVPQYRHLQEIFTDA